MDKTAIIGLSGRFPGAETVTAFWNNLYSGVDSISRFSKEEMLQHGVPIDELSKPSYVRVAPVLKDPAGFDCGFFGFTPNDAVLIDPQHRLALELAWEACEDAGYHFAAEPQLRVGVFASCAMNTYFVNTNVHKSFSSQYLPTLIGSDKDFLATRISHRLGLDGISLSVQTACSSSLVGVHLANQSLLNNEIDVAIVVAATVKVPHIAGYLHTPGSVFSEDGYCRPFDANASGTIFGSGGGAVVMRRIDEAVAAGDSVYAVIRGTAVNNDGDTKAEYTAPSVRSQAAVVAEAMLDAEVDANDIRYIEAHGTGTFLGDPIEVAALSKAFKQTSSGTHFCNIGSVKANIGHLDAAAGVVGLIKLVGCIQRKSIPGALHYSAPNPQIDFENSPFSISPDNIELSDADMQKCFGVTSLGIGGTNAHVVVSALPEAQTAPASQDGGYCLLPVSARSEEATDNAVASQTQFLRGSGSALSLNDAAFTLQVGRKTMRNRQVLLCKANSVEHGADAQPVVVEYGPSGSADGLYKKCVFMFTGQGNQYAAMGKELYECYPAYRVAYDQCQGFIEKYAGTEAVRQNFTLGADVLDESRTDYAQPALFAVEYATARLFMSLGIKPDMLMGHSIGEYVAACLAGVFTLEDAIKTVVLRGELMQSLPGGSMLAINGVEATVIELLDNRDAVDIACRNSTGMFVLSGDTIAIEKVQRQLAESSVNSVLLKTSHAFHSRMMQSALEPFNRALSGIKLSAPLIPIISNVTGRELTDQEACNPEYWSSHILHTVNYDKGLESACRSGDSLFLEVGPGRSLTTFAKRHSDIRKQPVVRSMPAASEVESLGGQRAFLNAVGAVWANGYAVDWTGLSTSPRKRVSMPTYPFQRDRIWAEVTATDTAALSPALQVTQATGVQYAVQNWMTDNTALANDQHFGGNAVSCLLINVGAAMNQRLSNTLCEKYAAFAQASIVVKGSNVLSAPEVWLADTLNAVTQSLMPLLDASTDKLVVVLNMSTGEKRSSDRVSDDDLALETAAYYDLVASLSTLIGEAAPAAEIKISMLSTGLFCVQTNDQPVAIRAMALSVLQVVSQERGNIGVDFLDLGVAGELSINQVMSDVASSRPTPGYIAYRGRVRWVRTLDDITKPITKAGIGRRAGSQAATLQVDGLYLVTGGLGAIGRQITEYVAKTVKCTVVVVGRTLHPETPLVNGTTVSGAMTENSGCELKLDCGDSRVYFEAADVTDVQQIDALIARCEERYGMINGVIHAAGDTTSARSSALAKLEPFVRTPNYRAKVIGSFNLGRAFEHKGLDFMLLTSSLSSILGGHGYGSYAATNSFMDSFCLQMADSNGSTRWLSVNWDAWFDESVSARSADASLWQNEAFESLDYLFSIESLQQLIVCKGDLNARLNDAHIRPTHTKSGDFSGQTEPKTGSQLNDIKAVSAADVEAVVLAVWADNMGIPEIGAEENFFELGGTSLLAVTIVQQLNAILGCSLDMSSLFDHSTARELSAYIRKSTRTMTSTNDGEDKPASDTLSGEI